MQFSFSGPVSVFDVASVSENLRPEVMRETAERRDRLGVKGFPVMAVSWFCG